MSLSKLEARYPKSTAIVLTLSYLSLPVTQDLTRAFRSACRLCQGLSPLTQPQSRIRGRPLELEISFRTSTLMLTKSHFRPIHTLDAVYIIDCSLQLSSL